jgi:transposase InsO family protein
MNFATSAASALAQAAGVRRHPERALAAAEAAPSGLLPRGASGSALASRHDLDLGAEHGWTYLNAAIDCCTRQIVGWSLELRCRTDEGIELVERRGRRSRLPHQPTCNGHGMMDSDYRKPRPNLSTAAGSRSAEANYGFT